MAGLEQIVTIYVEQYPRLRAMAYSVLLDSHDADDVLQSVMVKLVEQQEALVEVALPEAFLRRCVRNEAISVYRKKSREPSVAGEAEDTVPAYNDPGFERIESLFYLRSHLAKESPAIQEAFISHVLDGYKIIDLAKELEMPADKLERIFRKIKARICRTSPPPLLMMLLLS